MPEHGRHLLHLQPDSTSLFITWRLHGSMAAGQRIPIENDPGAGFRFAAEDRELERSNRGVVRLSDSRIADLVADTLRAGENERHFYTLHAWVIMPNHVHMLMTPKAEVSKIMRWIKGSTARKANLILGLTGRPFWQDESWDHWVRNDGEFRKIVRYIEENPVTAGLAKTAADWPFPSATGTRR